MRRLALLLALLMCGFTGAGTPGGRGGAPAGAGGVTGDYVTIVVFGDSQYSMLESAGTIEGSGRYAEFNDTVDWIINNKVDENIDLVLHVGDMIDSGTALPLSASCDSWTTVRSAASCNTAEFNASQAACEAAFSGDGCGWTNIASPPCAPCNLVNQAAAEWPRFNTIWDRFQAAGIPAIMVPGNHDNRGNDVNLGREPAGWDDYFDDTYWANRETDWATYDFDELADNRLVRGGLVGTSRAYLTDLDGNQILVIAPNYESGTGIDATTNAWVEDVASDYPTTPTIILSHWWGEVGTVSTGRPNHTPNAFLLLSGHNGWDVAAGGNFLTIDEQNDDPLINMSIDHNNGSQALWTGSERDGGSAQLDVGGVLQDDYIAIVRWYPATDQIEIDRYSAQGGLSVEANGYINDTANLGATLQQAATTFEILPPIIDPNAPYDMTPWAADIARAFSDDTYIDDNPPAWATQPSNLTVCPATDDGSLSSCLGVGNRRITVAAGTYSGFSVTQDNTWVDLDDDAIVNGGITIPASIVKISGGTFVGGSSTIMNNNSDVTLENVYFENITDSLTSTVSWCASGATSCQRLTVLDSTFRTARSTIGSSGPDDLIMVNVEINSDCEPLSYCTTGGAETGFANRLQYVNRMILANVHFRTRWVDKPGAEEDKPAFRIHYDANHHLVVDSIFQCGTDCARPVWIDTSGGSAGEQADLKPIYILRNRMETLDPDVEPTDPAWQVTSGVIVDDSTPGGPGVAVVIEDNVIYGPNQTSFNIGGSGTDRTVISSGNTAVSGFTTLTPFSGAAPRTGRWPNGI